MTEELKINHDQKDPGKGWGGGSGEHETVKIKEQGDGGMPVELGGGGGEKEEKKGRRMQLDRRCTKGEEEMELEEGESWRENMSTAHKHVINIFKN